MIAQELEVSLHMAFVEARQKRHEFITVEHLLLALLDNPTAAEVLRACGANMDELRKNLTQHIAEQTPRIAADQRIDLAVDGKLVQVLGEALQRPARLRLGGFGFALALFPGAGRLGRLGDAVGDEVHHVQARYPLLVQEIDRVRVLLAEDRYQHLGAGELLLAR